MSDNAESKGHFGLWNNKGASEELSDETLLEFTIDDEKPTWAGLREAAMEENYQDSMWFVSTSITMYSKH